MANLTSTRSFYLCQGSLNQRSSRKSWRELSPRAHVVPGAQSAPPGLLFTAGKRACVTSRYSKSAQRKLFQVQARAVDADIAAPPSSSSSVENVDVVVVGAGAAGLTMAYTIAKKFGKEVSVAVTEARDVVGGNVTTRTEGPYTWEEGPNSFQPGDPILEVACDVGLQKDILLADPGSYRFVLWKGALRALPAGPADAVFGDFLTFPGKIRAGLGAIGIRPPPPDKEESVKEFVSRNLGEEAFGRLIEPFCSGVYAGDPAKLSAPAAVGKVHRLEGLGGSLVAGAMKAGKEAKENAKPRDPRLPEVKGQTVGSFRGGLKKLPEALAAALPSPPRLNWKLVSLSKVAQGTQLVYDTPEGTKTIVAKAVVLTAPAYVASEVLKEAAPAASEALSKFYYPPVCSVTVVYPQSVFREPEHGKGPPGPPGAGFGQLHPRSQGVRTLGTIYSSSLFPERSPEGDVMLLHYIGGAQDTTLIDLSDEEILAQIHTDNLTTVLKPGTEPPKLLGIKRWPKAIPQFNIGHLDLQKDARKGLSDAGLDGVFLGGNYMTGVALGRVVEYGRDAAADVVKFVETQKA